MYLLNLGVKGSIEFDIKLTLCCCFLQEKVLQRLNKHHNQQALTSSIEEGLKLQALNRAQRVVRLLIYHTMPNCDHVAF